MDLHALGTMLIILKKGLERKVELLRISGRALAQYTRAPSWTTQTIYRQSWFMVSWISIYKGPDLDISRFKTIAYVQYDVKCICIMSFLWVPPLWTTVIAYDLTSCSGLLQGEKWKLGSDSGSPIATSKWAKKTLFDVSTRIHWSSSGRKTKTSKNKDKIVWVVSIYKHAHNQIVSRHITSCQLQNSKWCFWHHLIMCILIDWHYPC